MRKIDVILAVPILLLTAPSPPATGQEVFVTIESHDYEVRQDFTQREILRRGAGALAYTEAGFGLELAYQLAEGDQPGHITAILNARLKTGHQQIEIPAEYAPNSCEYRVLLQHELQHVARNLQAMTMLKQQIEKEESPRPTQDFVDKTPDQVLKVLQSELDNTTGKHYSKKYSDLRRQLNDPLDTDSSRSADYRQCNNWLPR